MTNMKKDKSENEQMEMTILLEKNLNRTELKRKKCKRSIGDRKSLKTKTILEDKI